MCYVVKPDQVFIISSHLKKKKKWIPKEEDSVPDLKVTSVQYY